MAGGSFSHSSAPPLGWRPALDGLRALALILVLLFHFKTKPWFMGGSIGVDLFLVLSGFLITTLLLQEWQSTGWISLRLFYWRRALRLLPALAIFSLIYLIITLALRQHWFTGQQEPVRVLESFAFASIYLLNWYVALGFDYARGFGHLWSLSLEEQFYIIWPTLLILMIRFLRPSLMVSVTLVLVTLSASVPTLMPDATWRRLYYGSDFRAHGLLIGALASQLYVFGYLSPRIVTNLSFKVAAAVALLALTTYVIEGSDKDDYLYSNGGYLLLSLACAVLVVYAAFAERGLVVAALGSRLLVYVGKRSYALYLWHLPIGFWLRDFYLLPQLIIGIALTVGAAELSYRLVEKPALRLKARFAPEAKRSGVDAPRFKLASATTTNVEAA